MKANDTLYTLNISSGVAEWWEKHGFVLFVFIIVHSAVSHNAIKKKRKLTN